MNICYGNIIFKTSAYDVIKCFFDKNTSFESTVSITAAMEVVGPLLLEDMEAGFWLQRHSVSRSSKKIGEAAVKIVQNNMEQQWIVFLSSETCFEYSKTISVFETNFSSK